MAFGLRASQTAVTTALVAAARRFEPVWLESSVQDGAAWAYHLQNSGRSDESDYPSRLSYLTRS